MPSHKIRNKYRTHWVFRTARSCFLAILCEFTGQHVASTLDVPRWLAGVLSGVVQARRASQQVTARTLSAEAMI